MTLDGTTLLVVTLLFTAFSCFVWLLSAFLFKSSPATSLHFALTNFFLGLFTLFYILRSIWPNNIVYSIADINVVLGCLLLCRATQEFTNKKKTDFQLFFLATITIIISIYFRYHNMNRLAIISVCSISCYLVFHAFINAYGYMIQNFKKTYSLIITLPLLLMVSILFVRAAIILFIPNQLNSTDLRSTSSFNTIFLLIIMICIIGFNSTALGLVISKMITKIQQLSQEDPLTKTFNRRHLNTIAEKEIHKIEKNNSYLSVILLDIDHFKKVNDQYGHAAGDEVLVKTVNVIKKNIRSTDYLGRMGGEEFCIILPNTSIDDAKSLAERIRFNLESEPILWNEQNISITASFGLTSFNSNNSEWSSLLHEADLAMYQAKNNGRNQVVLS